MNGLLQDLRHALRQLRIRGRGFNPRDTASSPRVAVVNETFVRLYLGAANLRYE